MQTPALVKEIDASDLLRADKWTRFSKQAPAVQHDGWRLGDLFAVKRGVATGDN